MPWLVAVNRAEACLEKAPVDRPRELGERMIDIDDLVEPGLEKIVLPGLTPLSRPHQNHPPFRSQNEENHAQSRRSICKKIDAQAAKTGK